MLSPCARLVRIISPTILPRPRRTPHSRDSKLESREPIAHASALCSPCSHHAPHYTAQALCAEAAAYATLARSSSKVFETGPRVKGGRGVRYALTIANANNVNQAYMLPSCARLVRIMSPTVLPRRYARRPQRTLPDRILAQPRPPGASDTQSL